MAPILIVDDIATNIYFLETVFKAHGFETVSASNGAQALELARQHVPSLVITDILMPVMDGFALCREWRKNPAWIHVPFVFYTATYTDSKDASFGLSLGADAYWLKPMEPQVLIAEVRKILAEERSGSRPAAVASGPEECVYLKQYNEALVRKLEAKMSQLEKANLSLEKDLAERVEVEKRLREQTRLLDLSPDAIAVLDLEGYIRYWNQGAATLFGWSAAEALGLRLLDLLGPAPGLEAALTALEGAQEHEGELQLMTRGRQTLVCQSRMRVVVREPSVKKAILFIGADITEKKKLETQMLRAQRLESIGQLASGVAHDLNNILAPILMSVPLLRWGMSEVETAETLRTIENSTLRAAELIKQLLAFGRGQEPQRVPLSVRDVLEDMSRMARETFPRNIHVKAHFPPDLWPIAGDPTQLHQIVLNLSINARDAMPSGGTLQLSAENLMLDEVQAIQASRRPGPFVRLSVSDTGMGIDPAHFEKIFDPFFTTKEPGRGTGLGLATVQSIVGKHDGFLQVYSEVGQGTRFHVYLPALPNASPAGLKQPSAMKDLQGKGELILVVDDEDSIRKLTQTTLEQAGYLVVGARDGAEGLALFARHHGKIALVITDVVMPVMDGYNLVQGLRRMTPTLPIIAWSGLGPAGRTQEMRALGVNTFVEKPFLRESLLRAVHAELWPEN